MRDLLARYRGRLLARYLPGYSPRMNARGALEDHGGAVLYSGASRRLWSVRSAVMSYLSTAGINPDICSFLERWACPTSF